MNKMIEGLKEELYIFDLGENSQAYYILENIFDIMPENISESLSREKEIYQKIEELSKDQKLNYRLLIENLDLYAKITWKLEWQISSLIRNFQHIEEKLNNSKQTLSCLGEKIRKIQGDLIMMQKQENFFLSQIIINDTYSINESFYSDQKHENELKFLKFLAFYNFNVSNSNNIINLFEEYKGYLKYESKSDFQFFLNALFLSYIKFEPTESIQEKFEKFLDYIFESQNINDLDNINLDQISNNIWGLIEKYNDQIKNQSSPLTDDLKNKINNISVNIFNDETAGSGFIFSIDKENGILYMATNRHCVVKDKRDPNSKEKVDYLKLKIINEASPFTIQKENIFLPEDKKDMAIIRLKNDKFKNTSQFDGIKIDQNIKKGDFVISAGNSLGLYTQDDEKNITFGRIIDIHKDTIEHSCAIFHGNSGGPLFNSNGDIIGINTSGRMSASAQLITNLIKFFDKIKNEVQIDKNYQEFQQSKIELNKLEEHRNEHSQVL